jgi:hypothetical protein
MSVSEMCLDADVTTLRRAAGPVVSRRSARRRTPRADRRHVTSDRAALDLAHPYGSRIRHEDEKNSSAISMRNLKTYR